MAILWRGFRRPPVPGEPPVPEEPAVPEVRPPQEGEPVVEGPLPPSEKDVEKEATAPPPDASRWMPGSPGVAAPASSPSAGRDVVHETYLDIINRARQPVSANDPNIRLQADRYAAGIDRYRRDEIADAAEAVGPYASGEMRGLERLASERAGQAVGAFEAQLIGREIDARRQEVLQALSGFYGVISDQERMSLERELASLNASLERARLEQAQAQFEDQLGYRIGRDEVEDNWRAIQLALARGA